MSRGLFKSAAVVGVLTLVSRITGFVRDIVVAYCFGAGSSADAFFVAFRIPNLFRRFFAEGAFAQAFVPVLSEYRERRPEEVPGLIASISGALGLLVTALSIAGALAAPVLVLIFAPGFTADPTRELLTEDLVRITFPYLGFISMTALAGGILNSFGRFAVPAITPVLLNICLIGAALLLAPRLEEPVLALGWGVFLAGTVQFLVQIPALARAGLLVRPRWQPAHPGVKRVAVLMLPALFGASVSQLNVMVDTWMASFLETGSVSWLYYSDRLVEFPLGIFSIALATVILPGLSSRHSRGDARAFASTLDWALKLTVMIVLPAALGLFMLAGPLMCTLFNYGEMSALDVEMAARALRAYAIGLIGFSFVKVLAPGFFSRQDTRTPVKVGVVALLTNLILNIALVGPLGHAGLALATALAACVNAALLFYLLRRANVLSLQAGWLLLLLRTSLACAIMVAGLNHLTPALPVWLDWTAPERAFGIAQAVGGGIVLYAGVMLVFGWRPSQLKLSD